MSIKIVSISDGFAAEQVPSVSDPTSGRVINYNLTAADIANEYVQLPTLSIVPTNSMLEWLSIPQRYGVDFEVVGDRLRFLPGIIPQLQIGDYLVIYYQ